MALKIWEMRLARKYVRRIGNYNERRLSSPATGLELPRGFQEVKVPRFFDNGTEWW
jgi:hypothetical protein